MTCYKLPSLEYRKDHETWASYWEHLYSIFRSDFVESHPNFLGLRVYHRKMPLELEKEEAFYHITCNDFQKSHDRSPDFRRCERIRWVRFFIENYDMCMEKCFDCDGILAWYEDRRTGERAHILLEEERYLVVVEVRKDYCLLITAFYIEHDHMLDKYYKRYQKSNKRLTKKTFAGTPSTTGR